MRNVYATLAAILLLNLTLFSQTATKNNKVEVCMPISTAQKVAQDLLRYDSVRIELVNVYTILEFKDSQLKKMDSINIVQTEKINSLDAEIDVHIEKFKTANARVITLQSENTELQKKNKTLKDVCIGLGSGLISALGVLALMFSIK